MFEGICMSVYPTYSTMRAVLLYVGEFKIFFKPLQSCRSNIVAVEDVQKKHDDQNGKKANVHLSSQPLLNCVELICIELPKSLWQAQEERLISSICLDYLWAGTLVIVDYPGLRRLVDNVFDVLSSWSLLVCIHGELFF